MNQIVKSNLNMINFDDDAQQLIKKTVADNLTDLEFQMFLYQAQRTGLDPMARQIYAIKRAGKTVIQASIDGLRLVAQRHPQYAGQDEPEWTGEPATAEFHAKVTIFKFSPQGQRYPAAVGVAYWSEYVPAAGQDFMWKKMPRTMLAKVAEALALRKAFPQELSGIYTTEEMEQAGNVVNQPPVKEADWIENNDYLKTKPPVVDEELPSRQVDEDPKPTKLSEDEALIQTAEEIFLDESECNCGTKNQWHKKDCPKFILKGAK